VGVWVGREGGRREREGGETRDKTGGGQGREGGVVGWRNWRAG